MDHWRLAYLGIRQIPRELTEFELSTFFTFSKRELAQIDSRRTDLYRLAIALHVGFLRMTGRLLDSYKQVPTVLWWHLGRQLKVQPPDVGTLRSIYDGRFDTLTDHHRFAQGVVNFRPIAEHQRRYVIYWIKDQLTGRPESGQLMNELKRWFYEHHIVIPPDRTMRQFIVQAVRDIEQSHHDVLAERFGLEKMESWARLLVSPHGAHPTLQPWLWAVPLRGSTHQISEILNKINLLTMHGVAAGWPSECNDAIVRHYARRCAGRPPSANKRITPPSRRFEAACFMRYALCTATDQVLTMLRRWVQKVVNDASREVDAAAIKATDQLREFAIAVKALANDGSLSREDLGTQLCLLADQVLHPLAPSRRGQIRRCLLRKRQAARGLLIRMVQLPFGTEDTHPVLDAIFLLRDLYRRHTYLLPDGVNIRLGRAWRESIDGYDRLKAMLAFEWATLFALRVALRNGTIFIEHSFSFRSKTHMLIQADEWRAKRNNLYGHLGLPQDPKEFLDPILEHLDQRLLLLNEAVDAGEVRIDTAVHLAPLDAQPVDEEADRLRREIYEAHPPGQLPEIILEMDSATRFSWILLDREPRSRIELLMVYSAVLAHGTSLSAADISRMIPEVSPDSIRQMMRRLEDERKLRLAADAVLEFMHEHPIAANWGRADLASSDMMSLETTRAVWQARADPRRRTASIGIYTHVLDRWGIFYDQPIVLNERQAGAAIEGVVRQSATKDISVLAVDTHGYTDFGMGVARALGFDLCPRLSHLRDRRLHVPRNHYVPARLAEITDRDVRLDLISEVWDEFVRIAASIRSGKCTAVEALNRFGSAARGQSVYDGGVQIGRLFRSIFLIDYFTNVAFRTELQHVLNRGEAVHNVQRAIHIGKIPVELARRQESLEAVSSALTLLSNLLMAWNTTHMQRSLEAIKATTGQTPETEHLRRIAPTHLEGINLRGTFNFPVAKYARRILPSLASDLTAVATSRQA
ncbi:Tn3 family transposase [Paraburkholderia domus]|uniref:Tn3 family transposase n=1 Tax=Paraburkholderia domus TaxID=2793075 RepID=UPI0019138C33|nr:Tn3 family transposase [Paraburkholderia domus]MBK5065959.1 Tn3 family transposase [Burkholderia sp. R-70199]CAE6965459.1 Tn3 family transposase ISBusp1 [Paraburkholderia domus]